MVEKVQATEAFWASEDFYKLMAEFSTEAYLAGMVELWAKVDAFFLGLDVTRLDANEEPGAIKMNEMVVVEDTPTEVAAENPPVALVVIILGTPSSLSSRALALVDS